MPGTHWRQIEFDTVDFVEFDKVDRMWKGRSTFGRQKSPAFDNVDRVGDNVDRYKLSNSTLSPVCTDERQVETA